MDRNDALSALERDGITDTDTVASIPAAPVLTGAWTAASLRDEDWQVALPEAAKRELDIIADALSAYDGPLDGIEPHAFD